MDSLKGMANKVTGWVKHNVTGNEKATGKDYTPKDRQAKEINDNLHHIEDRVDRIDSDISKIADTSELRPPKLSDFSDKELVIVGATGGAAVGGALGMAEGVLDTALDDPKIEITKTEHDINRPILKGYDHKQIEQKDSAGYLQGYDHKFTPRIEYEKVGDYTVKEGKVVHTVDGDSPVMSGVKGMVTGALLGGGIGVAIAVGRKVMKKGGYVPRENRELEGQGKVIAATTALGAAGGAVLGGVGAMIEAGQGAGKEISFKQPVMESQTIGQVPQDIHQSIYDVFKEHEIPKQDVTVEAPKMEKGMLGIGEKPAMEKITQSIEIKSRFGFMGQVLGGAVIGAIGGALTGIMTNILRKII
ncbi:MAG: hypothetical protein K8T10_07440 [Candidatus Eremiobacteraeota bacterium]|nr:hypothetical protein [Candidatus Eremiobacteraeota bacterium]